MQWIYTTFRTMKRWFHREQLKLRIGTTFRTINRWFYRHRLKLGIGTLILLLVAAYIAPDVFIVVNSGESAVLWKRFSGGTIRTLDATRETEFSPRDEIRKSSDGQDQSIVVTSPNWFGWRGGTVTDTVYTEGLQVIFPWNRMYIYDIRLQERTHHFDALSVNGLRIDVAIAVRYRPMQEWLGLLHKQVGPAYVERLLFPEISQAARAEISRQTAEAVYTTERLAIRAAILERMRREEPVAVWPFARSASFLYIEDVLIRSIELPPPVAQSINNKMVQQQLLKEYRFRVEKEKLESERKGIEAAGIAEFNRQVGQGISDRYLKWKGIDATLALARSNNSKVVVIGAGEDGLPLILGPLDSGRDMTPPGPPAPGEGPPASLELTGQSESPAAVATPPDYPAPHAPAPGAVFEAVPPDYPRPASP